MNKFYDVIWQASTDIYLNKLFEQVLQRYIASLGLKSWSAEGTCKKILWGIFKNTVWSKMRYVS